MAIVFVYLWAVVPLFLLFYILWYMFFTDRDTVLAIAENFGKPVSYFKGKVVWITGASSGLGEAMAYELASVGAKLILSSRNKDLLEKVKIECLDKSDGRLEKRDILVLPFDICNFEVHKKNVDDAISHFGKVDVLVNNAGRYQIGSLTTTQTDVLKDLFDVNFFGGTNITKLLLPYFQENKRGHIVVVSSIAGKYGVPSVASYCATKHALLGFYDALRMEYHRENISVTIVCPGIFESSILTRTMSSTKGELFSKITSQYECANMTTARCAHLTLIASANKLFESWIAYQPLMFMMWSSQYFPDIYRYIMLKLYTKKRVNSLIDGIWPSDLPVWRPIL